MLHLPWHIARQSRHAQSVPFRAGVLRTAILGIWLVIVIATPYSVHAMLPAGLADGWGLHSFLIGHENTAALVRSEVVIRCLQYSTILFCIALLVAPTRTRWLMPLLCAQVLVLDGLTKSLNGYVNHAQLAALLILCIFGAYANVPLERMWKRPLVASGSRYDADYAAILWLARLVVVIPYTYIGVNRVLTGGVGILFDDTIIQFVERATSRYSNYGFTLFADAATAPVVALVLKAGFAITTACEVLSGFVLTSRLFSILVSSNDIVPLRDTTHDEPVLLGKHRHTPCAVLAGEPAVADGANRCLWAALWPPTPSSVAIDLSDRPGRSQSARCTALATEGSRAAPVPTG